MGVSAFAKSLFSSRRTTNNSRQKYNSGCPWSNQRWGENADVMRRSSARSWVDVSDCSVFASTVNDSNPLLLESGVLQQYRPPCGKFCLFVLLGCVHALERVCPGTQSRLKHDFPHCNGVLRHFSNKQGDCLGEGSGCRGVRGKFEIREGALQGS